MEEVEICTLYYFQRQLRMSRTLFQSGAFIHCRTIHSSISVLRPHPGPWLRCWHAQSFCQLLQVIFLPSFSSRSRAPLILITFFVAVISHMLLQFALRISQGISLSESPHKFCSTYKFLLLSARVFVNVQTCAWFMYTNAAYHFQGALSS